MNCPQCHNDEINDTGVCLVCGHKIDLHEKTGKQSMQAESVSEKSGPKDDPGMAGTTEKAHRVTPDEELPQWRKELSQRLQEIRQKKEANAAAAYQPEMKAPAASVLKPPAIAVTDKKPIRLVEKPRKRRVAQMPPKPPPRQKPLQPVNPQPQVLTNEMPETDPNEIRSLIDKAVTRKIATAHAPAPITAVADSPSKPSRKAEQKLIFLSRTLSGLVDLICVVFLVGSFIIAADLFGGIIVLDAVSMLGFAALSILTYFVYSLFFLFLTASSQTIGMMITELRVTGIEEVRPPFHKLSKRCFWHLISLLIFGIGLLWGIFDRNNMCLHDKLSRTRVIRN